MEILLAVVFLIAWPWSVIKALNTGILAAVLCFFFPPLAQVIFSIYEEHLRSVTIVMVACSLLGYMVL